MSTFENCQPENNTPVAVCQPKPVKCGCGGEAKVIKHEYFECSPTYGVTCQKCCTATYHGFDTEAEAVHVWNRAMGTGKDKIAIAKGNWMMTYDGLRCSVCNYKCETTALPEVCPHCGTSMMTAVG